MASDRLSTAAATVTGDGKGRLLGSVAFGWFLILGLRFVVPSILPTITAEFGATDTQAGLAMTVLWGTYALVQFPAGYYGDRIGERFLLVGGLLVGAAGLVTYVVTPTFALFVVATGVFGLGTGLYGPPRGTVVSKTFDENDGAAFGAVLAAGSLGAASLPAVAAAAVDVYGWRGMLGGAAPLFCLAAVGVWLSVPDTRVDPDSDDPVDEAVRAAADAVRERRVALAVTATGIMLFTFQAATAFLTTYLVGVKGLTQGTAGGLLGGLFVVGALSQGAGGRVADEFGAPRVLLAVGAVSVLPLAALPLVAGPVPVALVSLLIGVRMSIGPIANAYIIDALPDDVQGTAWGALRTALFLVASFGSSVVGVMADAGAFDAAFYLLAGLTGAGTIVYHFLPPDSRKNR